MNPGFLKSQNPIESDHILDRESFESRFNILAVFNGEIGQHYEGEQCEPILNKLWEIASLLGTGIVLQETGFATISGYQVLFGDKDVT
jgi:hypothetical protein